MVLGELSGGILPRRHVQVRERERHRPPPEPPAHIVPIPPWRRKYEADSQQADADASLDGAADASKGRTDDKTFSSQPDDAAKPVHSKHRQKQWGLEDMPAWKTEQQQEE